MAISKYAAPQWTASRPPLKSRHHGEHTLTSTPTVTASLALAHQHLRQAALSPGAPSCLSMSQLCSAYRQHFRTCVGPLSLRRGRSWEWAARMGQHSCLSSGDSWASRSETSNDEARSVADMASGRPQHCHQNAPDRRSFPGNPTLVSGARSMGQWLFIIPGGALSQRSHRRGCRCARGGSGNPLADAQWQGEVVWRQLRRLVCVFSPFPTLCLPRYGVRA